MDAKAIKKLVESQKDVWSDIDVKKVWVYYFTKETNDHYFATRKPLDTSFDKKTIETSITDTGIQKILLSHLKAKDNNPELAFSADGIDEMNRNIVALNNGKFHQPILKVRKYEKAEKFAIGQNGNKAAKFVEAAKGTNLFFAVFSFEKLNKETGEVENVRLYLTIPLNVMLDCQKRYGAKWQDYIEVYLKEMGVVSDYVKLLFILSPNDLVYLPTKEELKDGIKAVDKKRIYKIVSFTGSRLYAVPYEMAKSVVDKVEYTQLNKVEFTDDKESIKEICVPLKVDRLGNIIEIGK
jgi:CRISPR-associated endonuclease Csn1